VTPGFYESYLCTENISGFPALLIAVLYSSITCTCRVIDNLVTPQRKLQGSFPVHAGNLSRFAGHVQMSNTIPGFL
jgi:hypothetical protein